MKKLLISLILFSIAFVGYGQGFDESKVDRKRYDRIVERRVNSRFLFRKHSDYSYLYIYTLDLNIPPDSVARGNDSLYQALKTLDTSEKFLNLIKTPDYNSRKFWRKKILNIIIYDKDYDIKGVMAPPKRRILKDIYTLKYFPSLYPAMFLNKDEIMKALPKYNWDYVLEVYNMYNNLDCYFGVRDNVVYVIYPLTVYGLNVPPEESEWPTYEEFLEKYGFDALWYTVLQEPVPIPDN